MPLDANPDVTLPYAREIAVLTWAIEYWIPSRRCKKEFQCGEKFCALGVLDLAWKNLDNNLHTKPTVDLFDNLLDISIRNIPAINDYEPGGQERLYKRMKDRLEHFKQLQTEKVMGNG